MQNKVKKQNKDLNRELTSIEVIKIKIITIKTGRNATNCYLIVSSEEALVIDPGSRGEIDEIKKKIAAEKAVLKYVVNTHSHYDHIGGNKSLLTGTSAELLAHPSAAENLTDPRKNLSVFMGAEFSSPEPDRSLKAGDVLKLAEESFKIYHIPGHSPDSLALYSSSERVLFAGDLIFSNGVGRSDLPGGDQQQLKSSIDLLLQELPLETRVYPGHGEPTTLKKFKEQVYPIFLS